MRLTYTLLLILLCATPRVVAQILPPEMEEMVTGKLQAEFYMDVGFGVGEYGDNMDRNGIGMGGEILGHVQGPIWMGVDFHSMRFDKRRINYFDAFDGELFEIKEVTASRVIFAHAVFRFQPLEDNWISPYAQAGVGWHWFYTNTVITDVEFDEVTDRYKDSEDSRIGFALHAGIHICPPAIPEFAFDIRAGYFTNASVEYMRYDPELRGNSGGYPIEYFESRQSVVSIIGINVGVVMNF